MVLKQQLYTVEAFWKLAQADERHLELILGEIHEMPPTGGWIHGDSNVELTVVLGIHVKQYKLGRLTGAETGFRLSEDTMLAPDIGFIKQDRIPEQLSRGYVPFHPDLAVKIISPSNTPAEMSRKVDLYLQYGTSAVWLVYPEEKKIDVYEASSDSVKVTFLNMGDTLTGGDLLPNFELKLNDFFGA